MRGHTLNISRQRPSTGRPGTGSFNTPTRREYLIRSQSYVRISTTSAAQQQPGPSLTTEYTPRERGSAVKLPATPGPMSTPSGGQAPGHGVSAPHQAQKSTAPSDAVDPSTLPVATAPPSHPQIDPDAVGMLDGRSILEFDLNALAEKDWRRPGADISDWFNYGFDEISWEAYCYRRREVNEVANLLKANVLVRTFPIAFVHVVTSPHTNVLIGTTMKPFHSARADPGCIELCRHA